MSVRGERLRRARTPAAGGDFASLMQARHQLHNRVAHRQVQYEFLEPSTQLWDPDGNRATRGRVAFPNDERPTSGRPEKRVTS